MKKYWLGVILTLIAAVGWGVVSPLGQMIAAANVSLMTAMVYRAVFISVVLAPFLLFTKGVSVFRPEHKLIKFYLASGFLTVVGSGCGFLMSLEYLSVAEALIIHYTFPLVTIAGACWITHEKPTKLQILAGFMIIVGVYAGIVSGGKNLLGLPVPGLLWGAFAVVGISGQSLLVRRVARKIELDQIALLFYSHLFGGVMLIAMKSLLLGWHDLANVTPHVLLLMNAQSCIGSLLAYGLFYTALKYIPAATVSLLCTLEIVTAVALSALLVGTVPTVREMFGCAIIMLAVVFATVKPKEMNR